MVVFSRRFCPSDGLQHQCDISALCSAAIGSVVPYWVRECTRKLPPPYTSALSLPPDPLFLSVSASHSLPVPDPAPPSHPAPWHPPTSRGAPAVVVVAHPLLLPFSTKLAPGGGAVEEQRTRDCVSGRAACAGQQWWSSARGGPSPSGDGCPAIPSQYQLHLLPPCPSLLYHLLFVFVLDLIS